MIPKTILHLLSGGMDSTVMLYDLHAQGHLIHCALFDYKQRHVQELQFAKHHCGRLNLLYTVVEVPDHLPMIQRFIEGHRNQPDNMFENERIATNAYPMESPK